MDRSLFHRSSRDSSPLLSQRSGNSSYPLSDLDPRPYTDIPAGHISHSHSPMRSQESQLSTSPRSADSNGRHSNASRQHQVHFSQPPPPIASILLSPPQSRINSSRHLPLKSVSTNPLTALVRREKALQTDLQALLDAQSAGLLKGRNNNADTNSEAGSHSTVTDRSRSGSWSRIGTNGRAVVPVRQPQKKPLSLKGARRGILKTMEDLSMVKEAEASFLQIEKRSLESNLKRVDGWEKKIKGFEIAMIKIESGGEGREERDLQVEKAAIESEIRELEERLMQLRARDRVLGLRIQELGNKREADLSSFREAKREVEREVSDWLRRPDIKEVTAMLSGLSHKVSGSEYGRSHESDEDGAIPFLVLPAQRRTLPLATSFLTSSMSTLDHSLDLIAHEHSALISGCDLWSETVEIVSTFENDLRMQMKDGKILGVGDLRNQLAKMESVTRKLEEKEGSAQNEGWNLLICAVGAELEAFREGEGLLKEVLETFDPTDNLDAADHTREEDHDTDTREESFLTAPLDLNAEERREDSGDLRTGYGHENNREHDSHQVELESLQRLSLSQSLAMRHGSVGKDAEPKDRNIYRDASPSRSDSEDDGPPPALLVGLEDDRDGDVML